MPILLLLLAAACGTTPDRPAGPLAAGTNRHFRHAVRTTAPPEAVWAVWTDVPGWPAFDTELRAAQLEGAIGLGAKGTLVDADGRESSFEITAWEPRRAYAFTTSLPLGSLTVTRRFLDAGVFEHEVEFHGASGWLFASILGGRFRAALPEVMERVRRLAEERS